MDSGYHPPVRLDPPCSSLSLNGWLALWAARDAVKDAEEAFCGTNEAVTDIADQMSDLTMDAVEPVKCVTDLVALVHDLEELFGLSANPRYVKNIREKVFGMYKENETLRAELKAMSENLERLPEILQ